jgi:uncharacterized FAD-dependent dehydrogenase
MEFDVAIVGAGPAGLFAAYELVRGGVRRVVLVDSGRDVRARVCPLVRAYVSRELGAACAGCRPCNILRGVGGAGLYSSGAINLHPQVGGDLAVLLKSYSRAEEMLAYFDSILRELGVGDHTLKVPDTQLVKEWERRAAKAGAKLIAPVQRRLGTEESIELVERLVRQLVGSGVTLVTETYVREVEAYGGRFRLVTSRGEVEARRVILAPGRSGAAWFYEVARKLGIRTGPGPPRRRGQARGTRLRYGAPGIRSRGPEADTLHQTYDDKVRTFCVNPRGFVVTEKYDGYVAVNGVSYRDVKSRNTNFALLVTVQLTDPMEDTIDYGREIAMTGHQAGGR